ncbi:hypothetical protein [Croceimicrobium hydrocarbonivorans]|uniref:HTH luxR-type domain-containing protein n=1 Tax=Croceimicrobium hydrocarbonivorans TaxID=2761580 RepID=A0A7H0VC75_9FLAO|nr:hypothetical protein [Croceimicrobium hydrocarbonivorans]QNR23323.1 hypothetical protein H4K34_13175 [Croceimicrobium hydrocarbonivorans]
MPYIWAMSPENPGLSGRFLLSIRHPLWIMIGLFLLAGFSVQAQVDSLQSLKSEIRRDSAERAALQVESDHKLSILKLEQQRQLQEQDLVELAKAEAAQRKLAWWISAMALLILVSVYSIYRSRKSAALRQKALLETKAEKLKLEEALLANQVEQSQLEQDLLEAEQAQNHERRLEFEAVLKQQQQASGILKDFVKDQIQELEPEEAEPLREIFLQMTQERFRNEHLERYQEELSKLDSEMAHRLQQRFIDLKQEEMELLVFILNDLSLSEIAEIYHLESASINKRRYRLRKKLALEKGADFKEFIEKSLNEE